MSNSKLDARIAAVVAGLKHSILTSSSPGLSVNSHPNPFFLSVNGEVDLRRAAESVLARLDPYDAAEAARIAKEAAAAPVVAVTDEA